MLINGNTLHFALSNTVHLLTLDTTKINTFIGMFTSFYRTNKIRSFGTRQRTGKILNKFDFKLFSDNLSSFEIY